MSKIRITYEVDTTVLFHGLKKDQPKFTVFGSTIALTMLTADITDFREAVGLMVYGIKVTSKENITDES